MADDLVRRLRIRADFHQAAAVRADRDGSNIRAADHEERCSEYREAAARIEALEAALEPFAALGETYQAVDETGDYLISGQDRAKVSVNDLRRARAVRSGTAAPSWRCACGWHGIPAEMTSNPSGGRTCPRCGASGGLVQMRDDQDVPWQPDSLPPAPDTWRRRTK